MRNFKKALATLLAILMAMSTVSLAFAASPSDFSDFPDTWSTEAMTAAVNNGLINGFEDGTVRPSDLLSRAQMAAIINRALGATVKADIKGMFTDVSESDWFYEDVAKAVNMKTFSGDGAGHMSPNDPIIRQDAFLVIGRALVLSLDDTSILETTYSDNDKISLYATKEIAAMTGRGYLHGYEDGTLRPQNYITREEFAQVMHNIFSMYVRDSGNITLGDVEKGEVVLTGKEVTLKDTTINGDLIVGDGVGLSNLVLNNVKIKGRLLFRGAEDKVTMKNTTIGDLIVTNDVNGTIHFQHYSYEPLFKNAIYNTPATFLDRTIDGGSASGTGLTPTDTRADGNNDAGTGNGKPEEGGTIYYGGGSSSTNRALYYADYFEMNVDGTYPEERSYVYKSNSTKVGTTVYANTTYQLPDGFELDEDNPNNVLSGKVEKGNTLRLKVYYRRKTITLTFTPEIGDPIEVTARYGSTEYAPAIPDVPEKDGYTPIGWFDEDDNEFDPNDPATENKTYTPKYEANDYTATFYPDVIGGDPVATVTIPCNSTANESNVTLPDGSTLTAPGGKKFGHWYYMDGSEEKEFNADTKMPAGDIQVFPKWVDEDQISYQIETYTQKPDGTYEKTTETKYGYAGNPVSVEPTVPEHFELNREQSVLEGVLSTTTETVLKVYYDRQKHNVSFTDEGGTQAPIENVLYGAQIQLPEAKGVTGKTFQYWQIAGDTNTYAAGDNYTVNGDVTFTAVYQDIPVTTYTVTFIDEGGDHDPIENVEEDAVIQLPEPKGVTGKTFQYWQIDGETEQYAAGVDYTVTGNVTFTAVYVETPTVTYTVTFVDEGGDHDPIENLAGGALIQLPEAKGVTGKVFKNWEIAGDTTAYAAGTQYTVNDNVTFTAVYADVYTVTFVDEGGDHDPIENLEADAVIQLPEAKGVTGKTFQYWQIDGDAEQYAAGADYTVTGNVTFTAIYEENTFTVTFVDEGGDHDPIENVAAGTTIRLPEAKGVQGKLFAGWTTDNTDSYAAGADYEVTDDVTFTAVYNDETVTVIFDYNDDGVTPNLTIEDIVKGSSLGTNFPDDPVRDGFRFEGWFYEENENKVEFIATTAINADLIVTAEWTKLITVVFCDNQANDHYAVIVGEGETVPEDELATAADKIPAARRSRNGYTADESISAVYAGEEKTHVVYNTWLYIDENDDKTKFTTEVPITLNIAVDPSEYGYDYDTQIVLVDYDANAVQTSIDAKPILGDNGVITLNTWYFDDESRALDTLKDSLFDETNKQFALTAFNVLIDKVPTDNPYVQMILNDKNEIMNVSYNYRLMKLLGEDEILRMTLAAMEDVVTSRDTTYDIVRMILGDMAEDPSSKYWNTNIMLFRPFITDDMIRSAVFSLLSENPLSDDVIDAVYLYDNSISKDQIPAYVAGLDETGLNELAANLAADDAVKEAVVAMIATNMSLKQTVVGALIDTSTKREQIAAQVADKMEQGTLEQELIDYLVEAAKIELGYDQYINDFMEAMRNGESFEIFPDNIFIITAVIKKLNNTTYEYIKSKLPSVLFKIFDEDLMRDLYNGAMDSYKADCNAAYTNALAGRTSDVPTFVKLTINPVTALLQPYYEKAFNKFGDTTIYQYYDANKYAKAIEELLRMDGSDGTLLKKLDDADVSEGASGYKLRTAEEYYEWIKKMAVLGDDMALWFADENNVPDTFYDDVINLADEKLLGFLDKLADTADFFGNPRIKDAERKAVDYARKAIDKREKVLFAKTADLTENLASYYASLARVIQNKFDADIEQGIQITVSNDGKSVTVVNKANGKTVTKSMDEISKVIDVGGYTVSFSGGTFTAAGREINLAEYVLKAAALIGSNSFEVKTYENNGCYGVSVGGNSVEIGTLF